MSDTFIVFGIIGVLTVCVVTIAAVIIDFKFRELKNKARVVSIGKLAAQQEILCRQQNGLIHNTNLIFANILVLMREMYSDKENYELAGKLQNVIKEIQKHDQTIVVFGENEEDNNS